MRAAPEYARRVPVVASPFKEFDVPIEEPAADPAPPLSAGGAARRRFARAGTSGVLLTLASRPGMAIDICTTPSGSLSGGLKSHAPVSLVCNGVSPGYWKTHSSWPAPVTTATKFGSLFSCDSSHVNYKNCTMGTILTHQTWDRANLGMHLAAAYLNAIAGRTSFLTVAMLRTMWTEWQTNGYYSPTAGKRWDDSQIVAYLTGTMN